MGRFPLFSSGTWLVQTYGISFLTFHFTTPALDSSANENGIRNADQLFWLESFANGEAKTDDNAQAITLKHPFIFAGTLNVDINAGDGDQKALNNVLNHTHIYDHGPHAPTVHWAKYDLPPMRVDYILTSCDFSHHAQGQVHFENHAHALIWLDLELDVCNS